MVFGETFEQFMEKKIPNYLEFLPSEEISLLKELFLEYADKLDFELKVEKNSRFEKNAKEYFYIREKARKDFEEELSKAMLQINANNTVSRSR